MAQRGGEPFDVLGREAPDAFRGFGPQLRLQLLHCSGVHGTSHDARLLLGSRPESGAELNISQ
ncbi:hypothetical protein GCM10010245_29320 [Streptomyces spectabilis]|nr:hypothetical protein GCM10010245_29320 [Streptomyces spectabilis]